MADDRYKEAGVDIDAGAELVARIGPLARATRRPEVLGGLGHFAALWQIPAHRYRNLVLVSGTDGVGTKVKVAQAAGVHDTIGVDLVAMCVNDVLCTGAEPFFFLDYFATGRLDVGVAEQVIAGIAEGCRQARCALVGGETAEMPGVYEPGVYDLAGFCVGGVERDEVLDGSAVRPGLTLLAVASSGLHSNGYSLARKVLFDDAGLDVTSPFPGTGRTVGEELLVPTRIYVDPVLDLLRPRRIAAVCHITGGGLPENLPRVLRPGTAARIDRASWSLPPLFEVLRDLGRIPDRDLLRTFNCGVGLVLALPDDEVDATREALAARGHHAWVIGELVAHDGAPEVRFS